MKIASGDGYEPYQSYKKIGSNVCFLPGDKTKFSPSDHLESLIKTLNSIGCFPDVRKHQACPSSSNVNANPLSQLRFFAPSPRINSVLPKPISHFMTATVDLRVHAFRVLGFASQVHFPWHPQDFLDFPDFFSTALSFVSIAEPRQPHYNENKRGVQEGNGRVDGFFGEKGAVFLSQQLRF